MTRREFLTGYAARSRTTVASLVAAGEIPVPCACGEHECGGWMLASSPRHAFDQYRLRRITWFQLRVALWRHKLDRLLVWSAA